MACHLYECGGKPCFVYAPQVRLLGALDGLSRQARQPDYLVLVDDGSPLPIPSIIRCRSRNRIRNWNPIRILIRTQPSRRTVSRRALSRLQQAVTAPASQPAPFSASQQVHPAGGLLSSPASADAKGTGIKFPPNP